MLTGRARWPATLAGFALLLGSACARPTSAPPGSNSTTPFASPTLTRFARVLTGGLTPFMDAKSLSIDEANSELGGKLLVPDDSAASTSCLTSIWEDPANPASRFALVFSSNIAIYLSYPAGQEDYSAEAAQLGSPLARLGEVGDSAALIIEAEGAGGTNPGSVDFATPDARVEVYGYYPSTDLLPVAESIATYSNSQSPAPCVAPSDPLPFPPG
jgi:hypothetical protein